MPIVLSPFINQSQHLLTKYLEEHSNTELVSLKLGTKEYQLTLPIETLHLLKAVLDEFLRNDTAQPLSHNSILTTQEAAELLNVSIDFAALEELTAQAQDSIWGTNKELAMTHITATELKNNLGAVTKNDGPS